MFLFTYKSKVGSDSSYCLGESKFDYGVDSYMYELTRSDDDTAGHVSRADEDSDSEEAVVVVAEHRPITVKTDFCRLDLL